MIYTYFGFRHGKLVSVIQSTFDDVETAINCNYYVEEVQDVKKQIEQWKAENK